MGRIFSRGPLKINPRERVVKEIQQLSLITLLSTEGLYELWFMFRPQ